MICHLRPYRAEDQRACRDIYYRAVHEGAARAYSPAQRQAWAPEPRPPLPRPDRLLEQHCVVAERDEALSGFMSLDRSGCLDMAFVLPEEQGRGLAAQLLEWITARARDAGFSQIHAEASLLARPFLGKHGWHVVYTETLPLRGQFLRRFRMAHHLRSPQ